MGKLYTRGEFVEEYGGYIANSVKGTGIHSGTLIAQAFLESGIKKNTKSGSKLAREANNFFGIKCHKWRGKTYNIDTGEQNPDGSTYVDKKACFRAYDSVEDSISDYIRFLQTNPRYAKAGVFTAPTVKAQAEALKRAGYATDTKYAEKVNAVYMGIKSYIDKYSDYGISGIVKSFRHNPMAFIKRNKYAVIGTSVALIGVGVGVYALIKYKK